MKWFIALQIIIHVVIPRRLTQLKVRNERGSSTLELAIIAGALFVIAVGVVALISNATNSNVSKITGNG
ncbi:MAG: hypothetical protein LCH76_13935 [Actinobacteria bacterium]|nr:hypothetical protein [Actinomycetota bacterium]